VNEYCSFEELKAELGITDTTDDSRLRKLMRDASRGVDGHCRRTFYPLRETRYFDHPWDASVLRLDRELLEVVTFTTQNGAITPLPGDYYLMCGQVEGMQPYDRIAMRVDGDYPTLSYNETEQRANAITGIWGYHEDWANAWEAVDALAAGITAAATTLTVADADGADLDGLTPRFMVQQLIKVGSETMYVTAKVAGTTNSLTVRRGVNGTTAAIQAISAPVSVFRPMEAVARATMMQAARLWKRKDTAFATVVGPGGMSGRNAATGMFEVYRGVDPDVEQLLGPYVRREI